MMRIHGPPMPGAPPTRAASQVPRPESDQVTLGAELEQAGYAFGRLAPWYSSGQTTPVGGTEAEALLREKRSVEVRVPNRGYETLFDFAELEAMHALWSQSTELARAMAQLEAHRARFGESNQTATHACARLQAGKPASVRLGESRYVVRNLDELKLVSYLHGAGARAAELERPERAQSLQVLKPLGLAEEPLRLYRLPSEEKVTLGRFPATGAALDDPAALRASLEPLERLTRELDDPGRAQEAERMVRTVPSELSLDEKLERAAFAFSFGSLGHHDLYRTLAEKDQSLELAREAQQALGPRAEPSDTRDALLYLKQIPGQSGQYLHLLELSGSPRWASQTLEKLGPSPSVEQLENAAWSRLKWSHPTALLLVRRPFAEEEQKDREMALTRVYADCQGDMGAARLVWGALRQAQDLPEALEAHRRLNGTLRLLRVRGPGWWEGECLESLQRERRPGGALEGLSLSASVERLLPFLRQGAEGILLRNHSASEVVAGALRSLKAGERARTGVEERDGGVIVGGVRVPTRGS